VEKYMALQLIESSSQIIIGLNEQALTEWIECRQERKKPLSALALKKTQNLLLKFGEAHQQHIVDTAIQNDWMGLHPVPMAKPILTSTRVSTLAEDLSDTSWAN
jgi:hypothetical protein